VEPDGKTGTAVPVGGSLGGDGNASGVGARRRESDSSPETPGHVAFCNCSGLVSFLLFQFGEVGFYLCSNKNVGF
jgi:hypothetical protein